MKIGFGSALYPEADDKRVLSETCTGGGDNFPLQQSPKIPKIRNVRVAKISNKQNETIFHCKIKIS